MGVKGMGVKGKGVNGVIEKSASAAETVDDKDSVDESSHPLPFVSFSVAFFCFCLFLLSLRFLDLVTFAGESGLWVKQQ